MSDQGFITDSPASVEAPEQPAAASPEPESPKPPVREPIPVRKKGSLICYPRRKYDAVVKVNALALFACLLGFLAIMLPWVHEESSYHDDFFGIGHYVGDRDLRFGIGAGVFAVGTMLVLFFRFAGIAQLAGVILFMSAIRDDFGSHSWGYFLGALNTGFYLGLVAAVLGSASSALRFKVPLSERIVTIVRAKQGTVLRVNLLSVIGGLLGIMAMFLPWIVYSFSDTRFSHSWSYSYPLLQDFSGDGDPYWAASAAFVLAGSLIALFSPLGGLGQLAGGLVFLIKVLPNYGDFRSQVYNTTVSLSFGFYVAIIASALCIGSILYTRRVMLPMGILPWEKIERSERVGDVKPAGETVADHRPRIEWIHWRALRLGIALVLIFVLAVTPLIIAYTQPLSTLDVWVYNADSQYEASVAVYIDGDLVSTQIASSNSNIAASLKVLPGVHRVGIDYAYPDRSPSDVLDGLADWSAAIRVRPLIGFNVHIEIGWPSWELPDASLNVLSVAEGKQVSFDHVVRYFEGAQISADVQWSDITIILTDGVNYISWTNLTTESLTGSSPPGIWNYGLEKPLGSLGVWLNVTDLGANGRADGGDFFDLLTGSGGAFSSGVSYTVYVIYEPTDDLLCEASFSG